MNPLTTTGETPVNPLTIGAVHTAELGIVGAWTIHGTATIWNIEESDDQTWLTVELASHPHPRWLDTHRTYARGLLHTPAEGRRQLVSILTPQPGPTRISLGWTVQLRRDPAAAPDHVERAAVELADWQPLPDGHGPLGVSALTWLDRVVQRIQDGRAAERERDALLRRLRAGGVDRPTLAARADLVPSRISQICAPSEKMSA